MDIPSSFETKKHSISTSTNLLMSTEGLCLSPHLTHPGGFVQQELEGVVCGLGGLELGTTQRYQVVFHMLIDPAIQGLEGREREGPGVTVENGLIQCNSIILNNKVESTRESGGDTQKETE